VGVYVGAHACTETAAMGVVWSSLIGKLISLLGFVVVECRQRMRWKLMMLDCGMLILGRWLRRRIRSRQSDNHSTLSANNNCKCSRCGKGAKINHGTSIDE
jgi:hypothetical protein